MSPEAYTAQKDDQSMTWGLDFLGTRIGLLLGGIKEEAHQGLREYHWTGQTVLGPNPRGGLFKNEGRNLISYITSTKEVAEYLLLKNEDVVDLDGEMHKLTFRPWMTESELQRRREMNK